MFRRPVNVKDSKGCSKNVMSMLFWEKTFHTLCMDYSSMYDHKDTATQRTGQLTVDLGSGGSAKERPESVSTFPLLLSFVMFSL